MLAIDRKPIVRQKTGLSDSTIERLEKAGLFPQRVRLNPYGRSVGWNSDAVDEWLLSRPKVASASQAPHVGSGIHEPGKGSKKQPTD